MPPRKTPRALGPYVLEDYLAAGGMAEVYIARRRSGGGRGDPAGKRVCVKVVLGHLSSSGEFLLMFQDEAALARRLGHDNIVRVLDSGSNDDELFMVMELIEGSDLAGIAKGLWRKFDSFTIPEAILVARAMCRGLFHAHTLLGDDGAPMGVIHRDISPQNVLCDYDGSVKVTDFGIAKHAYRSTQTQTGIIKGKTAYMAPEQALGERIDHRVDQFATGVVLWELLAAKRLFHEKSDILTIQKVLQHEPPPPSKLRKGVPRSLDDALQKALHKSREGRFPDMASFARALDRALEEVAPGIDERSTIAALVTRALGPRESAAAEPPDPSDEGEGDSLTRGVALPSAVARAPSPATALMNELASQTQPAGPPTGTISSAPTAMKPPVSPAAVVTKVTPPPMAQPVIAPQPMAPSDRKQGNLLVLPASAELPSLATMPSMGTSPLFGSSSESRSIVVERGTPWLFVAIALVVGIGAGAAAGWFGRDAVPVCAPKSDNASEREMAANLLVAVEQARQQGAFDLVARDLERSLRLHGSARGYALLGELYKAQGKVGPALEAYACAMKLEPSSPEAEAIRKAVIGER